MAFKDAPFEKREEPLQNNYSPQQLSSGEANAPSRRRTTSWLVFIICAVILGISAFFTVRWVNHLNSQTITYQNEILELNAKIVRLDEELKEKDSIIQDRNSTITELTYNARMYGVVQDFLTVKKSSNESFRFRLSSDIVLMSMKDTKREVALTTNFGGGGKIGVQTSNAVARVDFTEDSWYGTTTTLLVKPQSVGTCVVTISNDLNQMEFRMLVIVTE